MPKSELIGRLPVFSFGHAGICSYCGEKTNGKDHVIAVSRQHSHRKQEWTANGPWTHCCDYCNKHLTNHYFDTFDERCKYVQVKLENRAKPILWHFWELDGLDYTLKTLISKTIRTRKWWRMRADWYGSRDYWLNLENLQWRLGDLKETSAAKFVNDYFRPTIYELQLWLYIRPNA